MSDSDHPKSPATSLIDKLPGALLGLLMAGVVWILAEIGRPMLDAIAKVSTTQFLVRVILLLVAVLLLAFAYILSLRSQIRKPLSGLLNWRGNNDILFCFSILFRVILH